MKSHIAGQLSKISNTEVFFSWFNIIRKYKNERKYEKTKIRQEKRYQRQNNKKRFKKQHY